MGSRPSKDQAPTNYSQMKHSASSDQEPVTMLNQKVISLEDHITDLEEPTVECEECDKTLAGPNNLYKHRKIHTDYKPHKCPYCDKRFIQRYNMEEHIKTHRLENPDLKPNSLSLCHTNSDIMHGHHQQKQQQQQQQK